MLVLRKIKMERTTGRAGMENEGATEMENQEKNDEYSNNRK